MRQDSEIEIDLPYKFEMRDYQRPVWQALNEGKKRVVACWHRGAGKDLFALNYLITKALQVPGVYLHCFPKYNQGKKAIWNSVHNTDDGQAMSYLDHIPPQLIKSKNSSDMRIELYNGSIYCVMGIDGKNATQARGMNPSFVIMSEYAYMDPESWYTLEPRVSQNNGTALFLSTPNGQNHFYHLYNHATTPGNSEYFGSRITIEDSKTLTPEHLDHLRSEGIPEDFIQQEYYCNFNRGAEGSYYGKQIQAARDSGRICNLNLIPDLPVHTAWDIGIGDATSLYLFQQLANGQLNVLHYYENTGEGLHHYTRYLDQWRLKHGCSFGRHFVPHDMRVREFTSGVDRLAAARQLGYEMHVVPNKPIAEGIQSVRSLLSQCSFDSVECKRGVQCIDFYRKKWNDSLKVYYDQPLHDQYSHGADAFRMLAVGLNALGTGQSRLTPERIREMRRQHLGI